MISTLWPVRDDEAQRFIHDVSAGIARGEPTASWAGFVVMGDARATLAPSSRFARLGPLPLVAGGLLLAGLALWIIRRSG